MEGYGLTEASPVSSFSRLDMPQKPGSIGTPIPGVEARIVDERGREVPRGTVGELILKGDNIMKGYYKDEEMTAQVLREDWLYTSDLGRMDAEGYIFLTGRKKRMIITSGFNVYPGRSRLSFVSIRRQAARVSAGRSLGGDRQGDHRKETRRKLRKGNCSSIADLSLSYKVPRK
jgi:acyl-CoA synthetase (AMP-forming)/AMP-acid ligase II